MAAYRYLSYLTLLVWYYGTKILVVYYVTLDFKRVLIKVSIAVRWRD